MYGVSNSNLGGFAADVVSRHNRYTDAQRAQTQQNILRKGNLLSQAGFKQLSGSAEKHAGFEESGFATLEGGGTFGTVKAVGKGLQKLAGKVREYRAGANRVASSVQQTDHSRRYLCEEGDLVDEALDPRDSLRTATVHHRLVPDRGIYFHARTGPALLSAPAGRATRY